MKLYQILLQKKFRENHGIKKEKIKIHNNNKILKLILFQIIKIEF